MLECIGVFLSVFSKKYPDGGLYIMITFETIPEMESDLQKVNEHIEKMCSSSNASMQKILDYVLLSRGKQLRPILTLLCSKLKGKKVDATEAAAVVEMCHTASLIHDDIIDNADLRRGELSVQKKFGREMAVYAGDFMIFATIGRTNLMDKEWYRKMFDRLEIMCTGEINQYDNLYNVNITEEDSINTIIGKTAALFQIACVAGANEGKCNVIEQKAVLDYAKEIGILFQLRDDLLDFVVKDDTSKKTIHNDFWSGYYTIPAIHTFNHPEYGEKLKKIALELRDGIHTENTDREITELINLAGGFEYTINLIKEHADGAIKALSIFKDSAAKAKLIELVHILHESALELKLS